MGQMSRTCPGWGVSSTSEEPKIISFGAYIGDACTASPPPLWRRRERQRHTEREMGKASWSNTL